jgi:hypothetical protein
MKHVEQDPVIGGQLFEGVRNIRHLGTLIN